MFLLAACTLGQFGAAGDGSGPTHSGGSAATAPSSSPSAASTGSTGSTSTTGSPFTCEPEPADSPRLAARVALDPAEVHAGETLTVVVVATNGTGREEAPDMELEVTSADGVAVYSPQSIEGGAAVYYYAVPHVPRGDLCLLGRIDGQPEWSARVTVEDWPPVDPPPDAVWTLVSNHQWTCEENPEWGDFIDVVVLDEAGAPLEGVPVRVVPADSTDLATLYNKEVPLPGLLWTGPDGSVRVENVWPTNDNGLTVFKVWVDDGYSDVATEITTGWWEDDLAGCNYCSTYAVNVWGHWSHTVTFQRTPGARSTCTVGVDHAGMSRCGEPRHVHHHPTEPSCRTW